MEISVTNHRNAVILRPHGNLSSREVDLAELVAAATDEFAAGRRQLVLDLVDVQFVNSSGLNALVRIVAQANLHEGRVVLARPTSTIANLIELTRLDQFFEVLPTIEEGLARFSLPPVRRRAGQPRPAPRGE